MLKTSFMMILLGAAPAASPTATPKSPAQPAAAPATGFEVTFSEALLGSLLTAAAPIEEDVEQEIGMLGLTRTVQVHIKLTDPVVRVQKDGSFKPEIVAVEIADKKGTIKVETDEEPGKGNIEKLPGLRTAFQKDGTITAGNASSINDGGAALVLMSADEAKKRGLKILAKLVSWGYHAQAPEWFTTAPAQAITNALTKAKWDAKKVDLWEINEAFAVVSLANNQLLGLDASKVNIWGGAVALGHPIGASGARILVTLVHQMIAKDAKTGGASLCIGGGEGIALLVERP